MPTRVFHKTLLRDKAIVHCEDIAVSRDGVSWVHMTSLHITEEGTIVAVEESPGHQCVLMTELQACQVQINASTTTQNTRRKFGKKTSDAEAAGHETLPVLLIRSVSNDKLYLEISTQSRFLTILSALLAWQNMSPRGLAKKWFAENRYHNPSLSAAGSHELLVCRFKIYAPIPSKAKSINVVSGPRAPAYFDDLKSVGGRTGLAPASTPDGNVPEGWFYTMGVLKSNGRLDFITELDGTLLYSIDITKLLASEIREIHHSICNSPNMLFIGQISELRMNGVIKNISSITSETSSPALLTKEGRPVASNSRILIEFPLHIDLEDWFVGLNYFCKREYIGIYDENSVFANPTPKSVVSLEGTIDPDQTFDSTQSLESADSSGEEIFPRKRRPALANFSKDHLRVSKRVTIDLIEAKFDNMVDNTDVSAKIYAEVIMWGYPWARTSIVGHTQNPFWKEEFSTDLPISTQVFRIVIKRCSGDQGYSAADEVIGNVFITPDILTQKLRNVSTMMVESSSGDHINVPGSSPVSHNLAAAAAAAPQNNNIVRLAIYDEGNLPVGKLLLTVDLKEYFILPPTKFRNLEAMLMKCPMKELIEFCNRTIGTSEIENVSYILLDIFQSLGNEEDWFKSLIEAELVAVDKITGRNSSYSRTSVAQSVNVFNTLFRGSSIFTKSLERYNFRVGQEYLEKVFGNFFEKISSENKNCEIDPRHVRLQEKARKRRKDVSLASEDDLNEESDTDSDDPDEKLKFEERVQRIIETNFDNLYTYVEDIWSKIYRTSNDLPKQIKNQLKNFRNKVELVCDPEDKSTSLNCMSAFIFLRFFCPAILNPKLFYLTKDHQRGRVQRTLTVIAKVLLNLANRQLFSPHKEEHLVKMNKFLERHKNEVLDYFDKISGRKDDFNEKILSLSHEMKRFDLGLGGGSDSSELPTTPYLIDKNLRLTELIHLLQLTSGTSRYSKLMSSVPSNSVATTLSPDPPGYKLSKPTKSSQRDVQQNRDASFACAEDIRLNNERNVYQIGSLEFEKSEFLSLAGDTETEGFLKSLCRSNEKIFSFITSNVTLEDLRRESANLGKKIFKLAERLQQPEVCSNLQHDSSLWEAFVNDILERACLNMSKNCIVYYDPVFQNTQSSRHKLLVDNALSSTRLKFTAKGSLTKTLISQSLTSTTRRNTKNPFRKWLSRDS